MYVIKRKGNNEPVNFAKIQQRIQWLKTEPYPLNNVNDSELAQMVIQSLRNDIHTSEIDSYAANLCASLSTRHTDYGVLAGRIAINNHHKNTLNSFRDKIDLLYLRKDNDNSVCPLITDEFYKFVKKNHFEIDKEIDYSLDYNIDFTGFKTLESSYLLKLKDSVIERPQDMFMRVAIAIRMGSGLKEIFKVYHRLSQKYYTHATPTLFNAGTPKGQFSSCFLIGSEDSLEGIMKTLTDCVQISKWAGGIGFHMSNWRARGSLIRGTNGKSSGIIPFLRMFNDGARAFNQGGKRSGSFAAYIEPSHPDILDFLALRDPKGDENMRCKDLFLAVWISDLFMQRLEKDEVWSLFCPDSCPGLTETYGEEYNALYLKYEAEGKYSAQIPAREIWHKIYDSQCVSGMPYLLYKDAVNRSNMQNNLGTIKSSNLCSEITLYSDSKEYATCFTGDTQILTKDGYRRIDECDGKQVLSCYNNDQELEYKETFVKAKLIDNGIQDVFELVCTGTNSIKTTANHLFLTLKKRNYEKKVNTYEWKKLSELNENDKILLPSHKVLDSYDIKNEIDEDYLTVGWILGDGWQCTDKNGSTVYGTCFVPTDQFARDRVISKLFQWCDEAEFHKYGRHKKNKNYYTDKNGVYNWSSSKQNFIKNIQDRFGLMPHKTIQKVIPDKIIKSDSQKIASMLSGLFSADGSVYYNTRPERKSAEFNISLSSSSKTLIYQVQNLLRCFGIHSRIVWSYIKSRDRYQGKLIICNISSIENYRKYIGFSLSKEKQEKMESGLNTKPKRYTFREFVKVKSITPLGKETVYDLNVPKTHNFIAEGMTVHNCNLASICLPKFVRDSYHPDEDKSRPLNHNFPIYPIFDYKLLAVIAGELVVNLNNVIDKNYYPVLETARSNFKHRPLGIGVQGLADVFLKFRVPFDSPEAKDINKRIFETIYYGSVSRSTELCRDIYLDAVKNIQNGKVYTHRIFPKQVKYEYPELKKEESKLVFKTVEEIPTTIGAYSSFEGSHASQGRFHWEMHGLPEGQLSGMYDWETVRCHVRKFGLRNSVLVALMPTASTGSIMGNSPCFEPYTSNLFARQLKNGNYIVLNKFLIHDLQEYGLWSDTMKQYIMANGGSIQNIEGIPDEMKAIYKTSWEIKQKVIINLAIDRQPFVDQSQSMNLFMNDFTYSRFTSTQFYIWKNNLKTGSYYLHTRPAVVAQKFTLDTDIEKSVREKEEKRQDDIKNTPLLIEENMCLMCGS